MHHHVRREDRDGHAVVLDHVLVDVVEEGAGQGVLRVESQAQGDEAFQLPHRDTDVPAGQLEVDVGRGLHVGQRQPVQRSDVGRGVERPLVAVAERGQGEEQLVEHGGAVQSLAEQPPGRGPHFGRGVVEHLVREDEPQVARLDAEQPRPLLRVAQARAAQARAARLRAGRGRALPEQERRTGLIRERVHPRRVGPGVRARCR